MRKLTYLIALSMALILFANTMFAQDTGGKGDNKGGLVKTVVAITGTVHDATTHKPVSLEIEVYNNSNKKILSTKSNSTDGSYYITSLKPGTTYSLHIRDENYLAEIIDMKIPETDEYDEFSRDILVYQAASNTKITIKVPPFELNKSKIKYGYAVLLEDYLNILLANPDKEFVIMCFPDDNDNPAENMKLTKKRAESLLDFFTINGIDPVRITTKGNTSIDPDNPKPIEKAAKGKRYIGTTYIILK